jgi:hypothetical protein
VVSYLIPEKKNFLSCLRIFILNNVNVFISGSASQRVTGQSVDEQLKTTLPAKSGNK